MIASLPMYDTAVTRGANDRFWHSIRQEIGFGPEKLDRSRDPHEVWADPDLLLSQTCGLPFRTEFHTKTQLVGTPDYGLSGCPAGYYRSHLVVPADDPRRVLSDYADARLARNDPRSQSGWAAIEQQLVEEKLPFSFADRVLETGSHANSVHAVAEGRADIAAIDAVTWALLERDDPVTKSLRVLQSTEPTPGLPLITGPDQDARLILRAVRNAVSRLGMQDRELLHLKGIVEIPAHAYLSVPTP